VVVPEVVRSAAPPRAQPPVVRAPLGTWTSKCTKVGDLWEGLTGRLEFDEVKGKAVARGSFDFIGRSTTAQLSGAQLSGAQPSGAQPSEAQPSERAGRSRRWVYEGEMSESGGLGTSWGLRLEVRRSGDRYHGVLFELVDDEDEPNMMCHFSWPAH